jgi:hypothetical protein
MILHVTTYNYHHVSNYFNFNLRSINKFKIVIQYYNIFVYYFLISQERKFFPLACLNREKIDKIKSQNFKDSWESQRGRISKLNVSF